MWTLEVMNEAPQKHGELIAANHDSIKQAIYSLRYRVYRDIGAIESHPSKQFMDKYDHYDNAFSYLYTSGDKQIGTIRTCVYSEKTQWKPIPAFESYEHEIVEKLGRMVSLAETTRLVVDPAFQSTSPRNPLNLFRGIFLTCLTYKPEFVIGTVIPDQIKLYGKLFGFHPISTPKKVPNLNVAPSVLVAVESKKFMTMCNLNRIMQISPEQIEEYRQTGVLPSN